MNIHEAANQFIAILGKELHKLRCVAVISKDELLEDAAHYIYTGEFPSYKATKRKVRMGRLSSDVVPTVQREATQYGVYSPQFIHTVQCVLCVPVLSDGQLKDIQKIAEWRTYSDWPSQSRALRVLEKGDDTLYSYNPCGIKPRN